MRLVRRIAVGCCTLLLIGLARGASANVVTCDDIAAAQNRGLDVPAIRQELQTTAARIEGCGRLAEMNARQTARRGLIHARRAARASAMGR